MKRESENNIKQKFSLLLQKWNRLKNNRQMPWKGEKDPYKIWLSEIILQQTRVEQGLSYYHNFIKTFPDVHALANADDNKVFKLWEGLGYYTRCRNLLVTARYISKQLNGKFPDDYNEIIKLKGIGSYTAAAISSFAYNLPYAVVDGNVFRVIARVFGIAKATDTTEGKKFFSNLANELLDKKQPGIYNQAIMDFGAVVCKPLAPLCVDCVFKNQCIAFQNNKVNELPVKAKKLKSKTRWFNYLIITHKNELLIHERTIKDIWQNLYEFTLIEASKEENLKTILKVALKKNILNTKYYKVISSSPVYKQQLSHQLIKGRFIEIELSKQTLLHGNGIWVKRTDLRKYPFPRFINQYLEQNI
ncbi:MAG: A/G-specific adenine glycosylase [Bacteroidota bacterium]